MEMVYNWENEIKQAYLSEKTTATAESDQFVLRSLDEYESLSNKSVYNFSHVDIKEMLAMQFNNSTRKSIEKNVSIIRKYIDYCITNRLVAHGENRLATFTTKDAEDLVHRQAILRKYVPKDLRIKYENMLFNEQDKLFIRTLNLGVRGRPTIDCTFEEIINLRMGDVNEEKKIVTLRQNDGQCRRMEIDLNTIGLIRDTYEQKKYLENNGEETLNRKINSVREITINPVEDFVFRVPGQDKFEKISPQLISSRMTRMKTWLDNPYLNPTTLYNSGMIDMCFDLLKENGEVTKEDYVRIADRYNYGSGDPERYWFNIKSLFEQYKELLK
jgi:site-specific recombinase XerD